MFETVREAIEWLGISWDEYEAVMEASKDLHGGPIVDALLEARDAPDRGLTPEQFLQGRDLITEQYEYVTESDSWDTTELELPGDDD